MRHALASAFSVLGSGGRGLVSRIYETCRLVSYVSCVCTCIVASVCRSATRTCRPTRPMLTE